MKFLITVAFTLLFLMRSFGQSGQLDQSFGFAGKVESNLLEAANSIAIQGDNKILVAGKATTTSYDKIAVCRFLANGAVDSFFGLNGLFERSQNDTGTVALSVIIQPDNKILIAGYYQAPSPGKFNGVVVMRLSPVNSLWNEVAMEIISLKSGCFRLRTEITSTIILPMQHLEMVQIITG